MEVGEVLNGYRSTTPPTNAGGGMSQCSFAEKEGSEFFFRMFLAPKFPLDDGPGSPTAKARKREACLVFEERHLDIAQRLQRVAPGSGNLVIPRDFFRVDATYVKVMDRVVPVTEPQVHEMEPGQRLVFLRSLAYSLQLLHDQDVVHGDLKPDNVLVQQAGPGLYAAMLIDFDEGYVVGKPPSPEHIVGDPSYYSPELLRYIKQDERLPENALSTASDMFSFGLLLHWFLTGEAPRFGRDTAKYPAEALLMRQVLDVSSAPLAFRDFLACLLDIVPSNRPTIAEVISFLSAATDRHVSGHDVTAIPVESPARTAESKSISTRLTVSGALRTSADRSLHTVPTGPAVGGAAVRGGPRGPDTAGGTPTSPASRPELLAGPRAATDPGSDSGLTSTMGKRKPRPPGEISTGPPAGENPTDPLA